METVSSIATKRLKHRHTSRGLDQLLNFTSSSQKPTN